MIYLYSYLCHTGVLFIYLLTEKVLKVCLLATNEIISSIIRQSKYEFHVADGITWRVC